MALNTVTDAVWVSAANRGHPGPFRHTNGDLYIVAEDLNTADDISVFRSTNGGSTWTRQDTANQPNITNGFESLAAVLDGTTLHIITISTQYTSGMTDPIDVEYHTFSVSSNTWGTTNESVESPDMGTTTARYYAVDVAVRSDGDVIALHPTAHTEMGSDYWALGYSRRESGSWTNNGGIQTTTADQYGYMVMAPNDECHMVYRRDNTLRRGRTLDSANNLSAVIGINNEPDGRPITWDNSGTQQVLTVFFAPASTVRVERLKEDASGDLASDTTSETIQDSTPSSASNVVGIAWDSDNSEAYVLWSGPLSDLFYDKGSHGASWGTDVEQEDATTITAVWANFYNSTIAYVVRDSTTVKYGELSVSGADPIDLTHFNAAATFYSPQLDGNIDLTHFNAAATFYSIFIDGNIDLNLFDGSATFFAPEFVGAIDLAFFNGSATFFDPTVAASSIDLNLLSNTTFFAITVADGSTPLDMDLFNAAATFFSTFIDGNIDLDLFNAAATFFAPQLDGNIDLTLLSSTTFFSTFIDGNIDLNLFDGSATFFSPQFDGNIDLTLLSSTTFFNPVVAFSDIRLDLLSSTTFFSITVSAGSTPLDMDLFDGSATFNSPHLAGAIDLTLLNGAATFFSPQLDGNIDLDLFDGSATFPSITVGEASIDLDLLNAAATFFAPSVVGVIALTHLDGSATFFAVTVADSSIDLDHFPGTTLFYSITVVDGGAPTPTGFQLPLRGVDR